MIKKDKILRCFLAFLLICSTFLAYFVLYPVYQDESKNFQSTDNLNTITSKDIIGTPSLEWNRTWGGINSDKGFGIITDGQYIYLVGETYLGVGVGFDSFILKYNSSGDLIWALNCSNSTYDTIRFQDVVIDSNGDLYICGWVVDNGEDVLLMKVSSQGNILWNYTWNSDASNNDKVYSAVIDNNNNIYLGGISYNLTTSKTNALIMKYNSSGSLVWNRTWGGILDNDNANDIGLDFNNLYLIGTTNSYGSGKEDAFIAKYDLNGQLIWNKTFGGTENDRGSGFTVDSSHNIYFTGNTENFGAVGRDIILVKYNSAGTRLWNTTFGGIYNDIGNNLAIDNQMNIYLSGSIGITGGMIQKTDGIFVIFDPNGQQIWNDTWGSSTGSENGNEICWIGNYVYYTGEYYNETLVSYQTILFKYYVNLPEVDNGDNIPGFHLISILLSLTFLIGLVLVYLRNKDQNIF
ncbi:MAG: hypothetical protein EU551_01065 [Promethearchaeota archaeon]|nr:MAG: hypothetical protein EU551_01065 [Candidatus Lokiarchaeota archaeon]